MVSISHMPQLTIEQNLILSLNMFDFMVHFEHLMGIMGWKMKGTCPCIALNI